MPRISRIAGTFAIVMIAYWAYALTAVPWIEPTIDQDRAEEISQQQRDRAGSIAIKQLKRIEKLFPRDGLKALGLDKPVILESNSSKLLFQTYENQPDGGILLKPCVIVFDHDGPANDEAQRERQAVILEAPGGARLYFDPPLDINQAKLGRLIKGQLDGPVVIRSGWRQPGPEDDLLITTRDLQLTEQTVFTTHPVEFRWGPHFGRGREMIMQLRADKSRRKTETTGPEIAGVESFELCRIERLHLDLGQVMSGDDGKTSSVPVEIRCLGPFRFDVQHRVASFRDRVEVFKLNPGAPADQITCDVLSMHFIERKPEPKDSGKKSKAEQNSLDLVAERLECRGDPVVVTVPARNLTARAPQIEYNLINEAVAAQGPGRLIGKLDQSSDRLLEAAWNNKMSFSKHQQQRVISLDGGAKLQYEELGWLQAREIFFWLDEAPPASGEDHSSLSPDQMLAREDVQFESPQLSGRLKQLEVWFEESADIAKIGAMAPGSIAGAAVQPPLQRGNTAGVAVQPPPQQSAPSTPSKRFEVVGRLLQANVQLGGLRPGVSHLTVQDGVCFREVSASDDKPLLVRGDKLSVDNAAEPTATVKVTGSPARLEAKGLGLTGSNINLDRGENRFYINGPGRMDMPLPEKALEEMHLSDGRLTVDWRGEMTFDGGTARFEKSVVAAGPYQRMETDKLEVKMRRPIDFSASRMPEDPEIEEILSPGEVLITNRSFDELRRQQSFDRMQVFTIAVNVRTGAFTAGGPGWLNSVHYGDVEMPGQKSKPKESSNDRLHCLTVRFQNSLKGNLKLKQRQATFLGQVQAARAPVNDWKAMLMTDDPDALGPEGKTLRCDQLSVFEMPTPTGNRRAVEMTALGDARVEAMMFSARAHRITYSEAKDLLILEGDGRSDAILFQQIRSGAPQSRVAARKMKYWPKTKQWEMIDARSMQIGRPPTTNRPMK